LDINMIQMYSNQVHLSLKWDRRGQSGLEGQFDPEFTADGLCVCVRGGLSKAFESLNHFGICCLKFKFIKEDGLSHINPQQADIVRYEKGFIVYQEAALESGC
jgi:hypothetical protein